MGWGTLTFNKKTLPCRILSSVQVTKSNILTVRSSEQDVNLASVGEKLNKR